MTSSIADDDDMNFIYEFFEIDWINVSDTDCKPNLSCDFDQSTCGFDMRTNESPEFFNTTRGGMIDQALNLKFGEELRKVFKLMLTR